MSLTTKTLNPLHFEDLEPHRFEDLVRQLAYDFREWTNLEATGRSGSDDGFDIRGREAAGSATDDTEQDETESQERIWLIQCKREKSITPKKLTDYAQDILNQQSELVYGVIFAAACNFSKKARDQFVTKIREHGVQEFQLWGRAELEDMLFQPKNDHLLFAYFQISLRVQKRTAKTQIRARLATKRKVISTLGISEYANDPVLLRDPNEKRYPYSDDIPDFYKSPKWQVLNFTGLYFGGLKFQWVKYFAYLADDQIHFDIARCYDSTPVFDNPWPDPRNQEGLKQKVMAVWDKIPEGNRGQLTVTAYLAYDNILAIDEDGDEEFRGTHIYTEFGPFENMFSGEMAALVVSGEHHIEVYPDLENRIEYFPEELRERPD